MSRNGAFFAQAGRRLRACSHFGVRWLLVSALFFQALATSRAQTARADEAKEDPPAAQECEDADKEFQIGVPIDLCRLAGLTPMLAYRGIEPGFGSGYLFVKVINIHDLQFYFDRFYVVSNDPKHRNKVIVERTFVVKDLKDWVPLYTQKGYDVVDIRARKVSIKGGEVTVRFYSSVLSGDYKDIEMKIGFSKTKAGEPEMYVEDKVFDAIEISPARLFGKPIGVSTLFFKYFGQHVLTVDLLG